MADQRFVDKNFVDMTSKSTAHWKRVLHIDYGLPFPASRISSQIPSNPSPVIVERWKRFNMRRSVLVGSDHEGFSNGRCPAIRICSILHYLPAFSGERSPSYTGAGYISMLMVSSCRCCLNCLGSCMRPRRVVFSSSSKNAE